MKCMQCGSTTFTKIEFSDIVNVWGDANLRACKTLEVFSCSDCGHIIFFDKFLINKKNALKKIDEEFDPQISLLYLRKNEILKGHFIAKENELTQIRNDIMERFHPNIMLFRIVSRYSCFPLSTLHSFNDKAYSATSSSVALPLRIFFPISLS